MEKEKSTDEVDNEGSQNVWGKIKYFFSLMTIEPMMIVQVRVCFLYFKYKVYFTLRALQQTLSWSHRNKCCYTKYALRKSLI